MRGLARLLGERGECEETRDLLLSVIDRGNDGALSDLAGLLETLGDHGGADRVRRFGLDDDGSPAVDWINC